MVVDPEKNPRDITAGCIGTYGNRNHDVGDISNRSKMISLVDIKYFKL